MLATLTDSPFDDPDWVFEDKFDGFRMVAEIRRGRVALYSRNGKIISNSYVEVAKALRFSFFVRRQPHVSDPTFQSLRSSPHRLDRS